MWKRFLRLPQEEKGQALTEYVLIISLVAIALVGGLGLVQAAIQTTFNNIIAAL